MSPLNKLRHLFSIKHTIKISHGHIIKHGVKRLVTVDSDTWYLLKGYAAIKRMNISNTLNDIILDRLTPFKNALEQYDEPKHSP